MHMVAHSIAKTMAEGVPDSFGQSFWYDKVYFSKDPGNPVFVEKYVDFPFTKWVNNDVTFDKNDKSELMLKLKAQTLMHFSSELTKRPNHAY